MLGLCCCPWGFLYSCSGEASHCGSVSCRTGSGALQASVVVAHGLSRCGSRTLEHRLSSCGKRAYLPCCVWNLPGAVIKLMCLALAGRFLTTAPPQKSCIALSQQVWSQFGTAAKRSEYTSVEWHKGHIMDWMTWLLPHWHAVPTGVRRIQRGIAIDSSQSGRTAEAIFLALPGVERWRDCPRSYTFFH